ncbi:hypothetical protein [Lentzea aerocolonigenes]|uniref:hypothetical protein n=1 Tax=Lentzea aerocolonigenes TaxID=68170 RepID=UPI0004C302A4|nr:hypothetical protein [Lentzea aerocolonigenes]MCP2244997.1 hypothetical protein [Lentzea aerocolonigenes]
MKSRNIVLAVAGAVLALGGVAAPAASADDDVHRLSAACKSPSDKKINISWGNGHQSVTVYYNNHCDQRRAIELTYSGIGGIPIKECFVVPAKKKGSKKHDQANPRIVAILAGSSC